MIHMYLSILFMDEPCIDGGSKILDAYGSHAGFAKKQADAKQAYTQAMFTGVPTYLRLPKISLAEDNQKVTCMTCIKKMKGQWVKD